MKVKKVLSLVLAVVMVFTLIPAQLIASSGLDSKIGNAVTNKIDVSIAGEEAGKYAGCIDVALKLSVHGYLSLAEGTERQITMGNQIIKFDPTVLSTVIKTPPTKRGQPNMQTVLDAIEASPNKNLPGGGNWGNEGQAVPTYEGATGGDIAQFVSSTSGIGYSTESGKVFVMLNSMCADGYENWDEVDDFEITITHVYLVPQEGKTLAECRQAIEIATDADLNEEGVPALMKGGANRVSSKKESFVPCNVDDEITFSPEFYPVAAEYTVTFTGIKNADGSAADDVVKTVSETDAVEAPELSGYSTDDYDYDFAGWDKDIVSPATADATYTAQYTKKANDKSALQTEVTADDALNEADYTPETWAPFAAKLAAAKDVLNNADATKGAIATALNELVAARSALESPKPEYEITFKWKTADGDQQQVVNTVEGNVPVAPQGADANYEDATTTYTFNGWNPALAEATGPAVYEATYTSAAKTATVTFNYKTVEGDKSAPVAGVAYGTDPATIVPADATTYNSADGSYTYTLTGWNPAFANVAGDAAYTAVYQTTENPADYAAVDNALLSANELINSPDYEQKYTAASRQVLADAVNGVVRGLLIGDQATVDAMASAINQAVANMEVAKYDITYNVHGQDPVVTAYEYGTAAATVEAGAPNVQDYDDGDYHYTFAAWTPAFADVSGAATYTATFNDAFVPADLTGLQTAITDAIAKKAQGGWTQESVQNLENLIAQANQEYLEAPSAPGRTQQGAIDNLSQAIANALVAETPVTQYTITFNDYDATQLGQVTVDEGAVVVAPEDPTRADSADGNTSYTFLGWQTPGDTNIYPGNSIPNATANAVYTAVYEETTNYADLTALNNAIAEAEQKQAEEHFNDKYENAQRYNDLVNAAKEIVASTPLKSEQRYVDAKANELDSFVLTVKQFDITFISHEGTADMRVPYGETPIAPQAEGYSDGDYDYTFTGWDKEIVPATADATYNAQYNSTFVPADYTDNAEKVQTAQNILTNPESEKMYTADTLAALQSAVDNNAQAGLGRTSQTTVDEATNRINNAILGLEFRTYTIKFVVDGQEISSQTLAYGSQVQVPQDPTKAADDTYTYTFTGWDPTVVPDVTRDATYTAQFAPTYKEYTVKFVDEDGITVISTAAYHFGDEVVLPDEPTKAADLANTYDFDHWTPDVIDVAGDATYTATYTATPIDYTISFYANGEEISAKTYHYGDTIEVPANPTKAADEYNTYEFAGWTPTVPATVDGTGDGIYTATFTATPIDYTVTFVNDDDSVISTATYHYGDTVVVPADPTKDATVSTVYTFAGWTPDVAATVAGNATYKATYNESTRMYTVTVITKSTTDASPVTDTMSVAYGETPVLTDPATFVIGTTKYTFTGWNPEVAAVDGDVTYTAQYAESQVTNPTYTINFKYYDTAEQADGGNLVDHTVTVEQGDTPTAPVPANFTTATATYEFTGWDKEIGAAEADATYTAQYRVTPIVNTYEINFRYADTLAQVEDGHLVDHIQNVNEGEMPAIPAPQNFVDGNTTYTFVGWDKDIEPATGNTVYTAVYNVDTAFVPDMTEIEALVERYKQMVKTGLYNKDDLAAVKAYIDDIYDLYDNNEFTSQDEVDEMAIQLKILEDACRKIDKQDENKKDDSSNKKEYKRTSPATGDNASLVVMSIILVSSIGLAFVSIKRRKRDF